MINAIPASLRKDTDRIERAVSAWPVKVSLDHAIKWALQFDADDYSLAVRIIEHLDVLGSAQIRSALEVAHAKLQRGISEKGSPINGHNTLYAAVGNAAKSGAMIAYHYRISAELSDEDFFSGDEEEQLDLSSIENIVLVDDIVGTGKTVAKEVRRIAEEVYALSGSRNLFVLTVAGYKDGIEHVTDETGASVICALEYSAVDTVANLDAAFYDGLTMADRTDTLQRLKRYCRSISTSDLGYGGIGGLLVFDHNTPNTTLPIVWHSGKGWMPLFPRATKIRGAAKVLKSAESERQKQTESGKGIGTAVPRMKAELTLFVEGKLDEIFIDFMRQRRALAEKLDVGAVNAVALGGLYQSNRLIELLQETKKDAIFVLDDDVHAKRAVSRLANFPALRVLHLKPSFITMLDMNKLYANRDRFPDLPDQIGKTDDPKWLHAVEWATLKRGPVSANSERLMQIIEEFLDPVRYEEFVKELRAVVDIVFNETTTGTRTG